MEIREIIEDAFSQSLGVGVVWFERFKTGLEMEVYDVRAANQRSYVLRLARKELKKQLEEEQRLHRLFYANGVPVAKLHCFKSKFDYAYIIFDRLPGNELESTYSDLNKEQRKRIAIKVADAQTVIGSIKNDYGEISSWLEPLNAIIRRSEKGFERHGLFDHNYLDRVKRQMAIREKKIDSIKPRPFVYDVCFHNVIVCDGEFQGVIDIRWILVGDPLLAVGMGKAYLILNELSLDYIENWCDHWKLNEENLDMVEFYTLLYLLRNMGSLGYEFNGNLKNYYRQSNANRRLAAMDAQMAKLGA